MGKFKAIVDDFFSAKDYYEGEVLEGDYQDATKKKINLKNRDGKVITPTSIDFEKVDDVTPVLYKTKEEIKILDGGNKREVCIRIASTVGALAGLGFAFYKKKKFWGYVGYFILGSIATSLAYQVIFPKNK
jgi:hypothetical protein